MTLVLKTGGGILVVFVAILVSQGSAQGGKEVECYKSAGEEPNKNSTCKSNNVCRFDTKTKARGCDDEVCPKGQKNCLTCGTDKCNGYVCHQCNGIDCTKVDIKANNTNTCFSTEQCFISVNTRNSITIRGCELGPNDTDTNQETSFCKGTYCNSINVPETAITCYNCAGDIHSDCSKGLHMQKDNCNVSQVCSWEKTDLEVIRQCSYNYAAPNVCSEKDCNDKYMGHHYCLVCDSAENVECNDPLPNSSFSQTCNSDNEVLGYSCFTKDSDGKVRRGCYSSLTKEHQESCLYGAEGDCSLCLGRYCNNGGHCPHPSSVSSQMKIWSITALVGGVLALRVF